MKLKLIPKWREIALKSYSMWCLYLGIAAWVVPALAYRLFYWGTSPLIWGWLGIGLLIAGCVGRLVDQFIDNPKAPPRDATLRSPYLIGVLVLAAMIYALATGQRDELARAHAALPAETVAQDTTDSDAAFLEMAVPFVAGWEGLRLEAYRDVAGVWTICYGETKGVQPGDTRTRAECDAMLASEIVAYRDGVLTYLTADTKANRLPLPREVAWASFAYNVGVSGAGTSTATRRLNNGDVAGACAALSWWTKAGGRVIRGLVNRRTAEQALCEQGLTA